MERPIPRRPLPPAWRELFAIRARMARARTREIALVAAPTRRALETLGDRLRRRA